ncbi:MAG: tetratricopeptide repeat protein [Thermoanaerobaculaceae bacterium]|nr:tetratricopeptide repeat protein [Thermoanaerobaculaceae bacterium]MDI9622494.1 tetratricopeptide repeat protein [Acidobacteriota bacterium]NLH11505.1 tetratricopeptide repeat protein [Holophagae bacterium]HPW55912.1 tetratricopeptide repeat protein [Thermoanaerobaculaceae bacterium]
MTARARPQRSTFLSLVPAWAWVGLAALVVRVLAVWDLALQPDGLVPLLDERVYVGIARTLAEEGRLDPGLFFQPFLYPFLLGLLFLASGPSLLLPRVLHGVLGACTAALTYRLGARALGPREGLIAGLAVAFWGPLVMGETQLLATGLDVAFSVVLSSVALALAARASPWRWFGAGAVAALAVQTRPTHLLVAVALAAWVVWRRRRVSGDGARKALAGVMCGVLGFAAVSAPVAVASRRVTGEAHFLPSSGGLNLFIGNHLNGELVAVRPGFAWERLVDEPYRFGARGPWDADRYFRSRLATETRERPGAALLGLLSKLRQLACTRELPRNDSLVELARASAVGRVLVGVVGPVGLPFALLLGLGAVGVVVRWRELPGALPLQVAALGLAVALVFVSGRYRLALVPVLAVMAAGGVVWLGETVRARRWRALLATVLGVALLVAAASPARPYPQERGNWRAELLLQRGTWLLEEGRPGEALARLEEAMRVDPQQPDARRLLADALAALGRFDKVLETLEEAVRRQPEDHLAWARLAQARAAAGRDREAAEAGRRALAVNPVSCEALCLVGRMLVDTGQLTEARGVLEAGLDHFPEVPCLQVSLALVLVRAGEVAGDEARALELAERAVTLTRGRDAVALGALAAVQANAGQAEKALATLDLALRLPAEALPAAHRRELLRQRDVVLARVR